MSVSGISSSGFNSQDISSIQNQQRTQQFQSLAQAFQSNPSAAQTAALQKLSSGTPPSPSGPAGATPDPGTQAPVQNNHEHWHHRLRLPIDPGRDGSPDPTTPSFGQLGQPVESAAASTAQQVYGTLQHDLQQIALNSDLVSAQSAALQASALSVSA